MNVMAKLYQPGMIGTLTVRNRMVMTAMHLAYCPDGEVTAQLIEFYRARARGGAGLIVAGAIGIDPVRVNRQGMMQLYDDRFIDGLRVLTTAVHSEGAKIFAQLFHAGRYARASEYGGLQAVAPSAVASRFTGELPRELTEKEIAAITVCFAKAAQRAQQAGFDGIELTGSSGYLLAQFLSPVTNQRVDRYGGDLPGRLTFALEVVAAIRAEAGPDYPIIFRIGGNDFIPGGNSHREASQISRILEQAGVAAINVTGGWHESQVPQITMDVPAGGFRYLGKIIKTAVSIPVIMCNRMEPRLAEQIVNEGEADYIGMARAYITDPDVANKAIQGDYAAIRPCVACNQGCLDNVLFGKSLSCLVNAAAGREWELTEDGLLLDYRKSGSPQEILIVGAGVAGLEYARVAAMRGHRVTIWEENEKPGGQALVASLPPGRQEYQRLISYLKQACEAYEVQAVYGKKATVENIDAVLQTGVYQRVVIAAGSRPSRPTIAVDSGLPVWQARAVLQNQSLAAGTKIVILGAGALGIETALSLAESGTLSANMLRFLMIHQAETPEMLYQLLTRGNKQITLIDMCQGKGRDLGPTTRSVLLSMLKKYAVNIWEQTMAIEAGKQGVLVETAAGRQWIAADTVIFAGHSCSNDELYKKLQGRVEFLDVIGDAIRPGSMQSAIRQAYDMAGKL